MNVFGRDAIIGEFKLSDYGLIMASFDIGESNSEMELGMDHETVETFVGSNPVPLYLGAQYSNKLTGTITLVKNLCNGETSMQFTEHECREVLRQLTGFRGYKRMQVYSYEIDELIYFNIRVNNVSYQKINGKVVGIILYIECDSQFGWSQEYEYDYDVKAGDNIILHNSSDDLYHYLLPKITIQSKSSIDQLEIVNLVDNNWTTTISNISANEIITMDSKYEILTSSIPGKMILNDFNMHFIRFISGENHLQINSDLTLKITYQLPRKVGFL